MAERGFSDLLSSASSLLNSQASSSPTTNAHKPPSSSPSAEEGNANQPSHAHKPSYEEIYSSAQVLMNAAKSKLHTPSSSSSPSSEDVSVGKLAGAAGTLLGAVTHYGKIEETSYGKYAQKAQNYLQSYEIKHGKSGTTVTQSSAHHSGSEQHGHGSSTFATSEVSHSQPSVPPQGYPAGYDSQPSAPPAPPQGYGAEYQSQPSAPPAPPHGDPAEYHSEPSAPPQGYPAGYPPEGYPDAQQGYGYVSQGHNKPARPHVNVENYPPAGYPTSGGRPTKYS